MTNINLSQSFRESDASSQKKRPVDKGIFISITVLILVFLVFGILKSGTFWLNSKKKTVDNNIASETRNLEGENVDKVADFQQRMNMIGNNISSKKDINGVFGQIGQAMVQGSIVGSLQNTGKLVSLKIVSDNFLVAAKQLLSFKKSSYFSNVKLKDISRDQSGKVVFTLEMNF